jgi:hypothetical protein
MATLTRSDILAAARLATESAPISEIRYTDRELAEQTQAYQDAILELRSLRAKWSEENARQVEIRLWLEGKAAKLCARIADRRVDGPEIVTSAPDMSESVFPLCRPVLRGKVARRRIPALQSFFQAASIFLCQ